MRRPRLLGLIDLRIFSLFIIVSVLLSAFALAVARPAQASSGQTNVELIIDDSGSMAQKIGGGKKIDVAKQVFSGLVQDLPADSVVAVRTYGRRQPYTARDCADMELLIPFGPNTAARVLPGVQALKPNGMTPIAASLDAAAKDFAGKEGQNNIILLLSDGEEDCHGDPCAAAKTLRDSGIHLEINVIGLHVTPAQREQLQCVANAGGGKYYDAADAKQLKVAASEVTERVAAAPAPAPPTPQAAPTPFNLIAASNGGQLIVAPNDTWQATIDGKEDQVSLGVGQEAVFGFKDDQQATFDEFTFLILVSADGILKDFELLAGNDSPTGNFTSIGKFTTTNAKMFKTPYQEFKFPPVTAKYLKVRLLSAWGGTSWTVANEMRLLGKLGGAAPVAAAKPPDAPKETNLLAEANGGQLLTAPGDNWKQTIDGQEAQAVLAANQEAVYAFKDEKPATFDSFRFLIVETNPENLKDFELLAGNDSPSGQFKSLGKFTTQNVKLMKDPYQQFNFPPVTAKYLKVKVLSNYEGSPTIIVHQIRLMGQLK